MRCSPDYTKPARAGPHCCSSPPAGEVSFHARLVWLKRQARVVLAGASERAVLSAVALESEAHGAPLRTQGCPPAPPRHHRSSRGEHKSKGHLPGRCGSPCWPLVSPKLSLAPICSGGQARKKAKTCGATAVPPLRCQHFLPWETRVSGAPSSTYSLTTM